MRVLASIRSADPTDLAGEIGALEAGGIDGLHLDVMDGHLVPDLALGPPHVAPIRKATELPLDAHLMIEHPLAMIEPYAKLKCQRITIHVECLDDVRACVRRVVDLGVEAGIACFPTTPIPTIDRYLDRVSSVNPLGVDPRNPKGFYEGTYRRIAWLKQRRQERGLDFTIQADGGVYDKTQSGLIEAGADELVAGYPIFSRPREEYGAAITALRG